MRRFPVLVHQCDVVDHQAVCSNHPAGAEAMNLVLGTWPACVPYDCS